MSSFVPFVRRWTLPFLLVALILTAAPAAFAQAARSDEARLEQLEREVAALKAQIEALQNGAPAAAAPAPPAPDIAELERRLDVLADEIEKLKIGEAAATADQSEHGFGPAASKIYRTERGLSIGGYGELSYQRFENRADDGSDSGRQDELDLERAVLYAGYKFDDHWLFNSEFEYEHAGEEIGVEFAYLDYLWKPQANFRAGLILLPVGFINELHEPTVFLGAERPAVEQVILPSTWKENGAGVFGEAGPFSYRAYVVDGLDASGFTSEGVREGRQEGVEATVDDFSFVGRLDFTGVPGLRIGASAYTGKSGQGLTDETGEIGVDTTIAEGHVEWKWRGLELRALGVRAKLDDVARLNRALGLSGDESIGRRLEGSYVQAGYDLLAGRGDRSLTPYARWETYDTQAEVPAGFRRNPANDVDTLTLGVAFQPMDQIILKMDYQNVDNAAGTGVDQIHVVLGYIF
jgi:hypothetical protein